MRARTKEHVLIWIIIILLLVQSTFALALWRVAGRAHFLILPDIGRPREEQRQKTFERKAVNTSARSGRLWGNEATGRACLGVSVPGHPLDEFPAPPNAGLLVLGHNSTAGVPMSPAVTAVLGRAA